MTGDIAGRSGGSSPESDVDVGSLLEGLQPSEISEVLTDVLCSECKSLLRTRLLNFIHQKNTSISGTVEKGGSEEFSRKDAEIPISLGNTTMYPPQSSQHQSHNGRCGWGNGYGHPLRQKNSVGLSHTSANSEKRVNAMSEDQKELARLSQVERKRNFVHYERVDGRKVNVLQGLELHTGVFNAEEQKDIVNCVYKLQEMGRKGQLRERTYSEPKKWMRGKGRVTIQFGCCYNYAVDKEGNPPGIIRDEEVDPLPSMFKGMIKRLVRWQVLPSTCVPNSCIVNIYDEGDCIPPHIDHHDFLRPFCTVSFLTECKILFGSSLKIAGPGDFSGPVSIPLPVGSVLVLNGNGADIAKHCVPAVPGKRISVTFRKMDDSKLPFKFSPDAELLNIRPLGRSVPAHSSPPMLPRPVQSINGQSSNTKKNAKVTNSFTMDTHDFPPLGA